ncbi:hypothetical protein [Chryseobacterium sp.]|uniref:hypothetical protein n=1 Tax=Chryseobacterium sp. TaxID=1871047 RepID=UPI002FCBA4B3
MKPKQIRGVPLQKSGGFHDTESTKRFEQAVISLKFEIAKKRFFTINNWKEYCGEAFAEFKLYNFTGIPVERDPQKGDFIRINIPGPGETEAKGFDWVEVTDICFFQDTFSESILMTCRPSPNPIDKKNTHTAHFYSSRASSSFIISRGTDYLKAAVYGRNESSNFNATFLDIIRNMIITAGGRAGVAKIQWKKLTEAFLDFD